MTDLSFLQEGALFPPIGEAKRIGSYQEYKLMFDGNTHAAETRHFRQTLDNINRLALLLGWSDSYVSVELNYFKFIAKKTADFVCGEWPDVRITGKKGEEEAQKKKQETLDAIRKETRFDVKHYDAWIDVSMYGECPLRIYKKEDGKYTFTLIDPENFYKIVDPEDPYNVTHYVITSVGLEDKKPILTAQIHERGKYTVRKFVCEPFTGCPAELANQYRYKPGPVNGSKSNLYTMICDRWTDEIFRYRPIRIKKEITKDPAPVDTGLDDFAIIELKNILTSDKLYCASDFDDIDSLVAEQHRILAEIQLIFDKFTAPTGYGDSEMAEFDPTVGESFFEIGKFFGIPSGGVVPGYVQPDITRLQQYFTALDNLDKKMKVLSEMGGVLSFDGVPSGIAVETMKSMYVSELKKAERLTTKNTAEIVKLFSLMSASYGEFIPEEEISITWYDGLPNSEQADVNISAAKVQSDLISRKSELMTRYNMTEEEAEAELEQILQEKSDFATYSTMGSGMFGFSGGGGNNPQSGKEPPKTGDDDEESEAENEDAEGGELNGEQEEK